MALLGEENLANNSVTRRDIKKLRGYEKVELHQVYDFAIEDIFIGASSTTIHVLLSLSALPLISTRAPGAWQKNSHKAQQRTTPQREKVMDVQRKVTLRLQGGFITYMYFNSMFRPSTNT